MLLSEHILYFLAKSLYRSEVAHSKEMKQALSTRSEYDGYRNAQLDLILAAANRYGVSIEDRVVLDFGCSDGAITNGYVDHGARSVIGVDIDEAAIDRAR